MTWTRSVLTVAMLWLVGGGSCAPPRTRRRRILSKATRTRFAAGMGLFRARCADCHGMDARGVRGPDITQVWASGRTDAGLFKTIKEGVPGTEMPANPRMHDHEAWQILAYLRTLAAPAPTDPPRGNAAERREGVSRELRRLPSRERRPADASARTCRASASPASREMLVLRIRRGLEEFGAGISSR